MLALSPHLDDVVFSAWSLVEARASQIWTVFAGSPTPSMTTPWDAACGFPDSTATVSARTDEDRDAFEGTGAVIRHLPFLDGPYTDASTRALDIEELSVAIADFLRQNPSAILVVPAGAGARVAPALWARWRRSIPPRPAPSRSADEMPTAETHAARPASQPASALRRVTQPPITLVRSAMHADLRRRRAQAQRKGIAQNVDHLAVRDASLAVALPLGIPVVIYEELPYRWAERADEEVREMERRHGVVAVELLVPVDVTTKARAARAYASQVDLMDPVEKRLGDPQRLPGHERFWILNPARPAG